MVIPTCDKFLEIAKQQSTCVTVVWLWNNLHYCKVFLTANTIYTWYLDSSDLLKAIFSCLSVLIVHMRTAVGIGWHALLDFVIISTKGTEELFFVSVTATSYFNVLGIFLYSMSCFYAILCYVILCCAGQKVEFLCVFHCEVLYGTRRN